VGGFTTSHRAGTLVYMAPELWAYVTRHGKDQSPAPRATFESDIWTFGLVAVGVCSFSWTHLHPLDIRWHADLDWFPAENGQAGGTAGPHRSDGIKSGC
jgi:hypothetical protein